VNLYRVARRNLGGIFFEVLNRLDEFNCVCHFIATLPKRVKSRMFKTCQVSWFKSRKVIIAPGVTHSKFCPHPRNLTSQAVS
jgi:hypothetical protein